MPDPLPFSTTATVPVAIVSLPDEVAALAKERPQPSAQSQARDPSLPATTTFQEDLIAHGQRYINKVWEFTQALVTVLITIAEIYCAINNIESKVLEFAFIAIISTYYARTNHTKVGGVKYEGR